MKAWLQRVGRWAQRIALALSTLANGSWSTALFPQFTICALLLVTFFGIMAHAAQPLPDSATGAIPALNATQQYDFVIELPGERRILNLSEIEIWNGGVNVARGQKAEVSSTTISPAAALVDGEVVSRQGASFNLVHSNFENRPWARIHLPTSIDRVDRIVIYNRNDDRMASWRLVPFEISLRRSADGSVVWRKTVERLVEPDAMNGFFRIEIGVNGEVLRNSREPQTAYRITRLTELPTIDGTIDDKAWQATSALPDFRVSKTAVNTNSVPARVGTEVRLGFDDAGIFLSAIVRQPEADVSREADRDGRVWDDDSVEIFIAPSALGVTYFQWVINSKGVCYDGKGMDGSWNGHANFAVSTWNGSAWRIEGFIPWTDLGVTPEQGTLLGFNLLRNHLGATKETSSLALLQGTPHDPKMFAIGVLDGAPELAESVLAERRRSDDLRALRERAKKVPRVAQPPQDAPEEIQKMANRAKVFRKKIRAWVSQKDAGAAADDIAAEVAEAERLALVVPSLLRLWEEKGKAESRGFALSTASPLAQTSLEVERLTFNFAATRHIRLARNEYESFQLQIVPFARPLRKVRWRMSPLVPFCSLIAPR